MNSTDQSSTPYYGPLGESQSDIFLEKTFLASGYLTGVGYGIQLVIYTICIRGLLQRKPTTNFTRFLIAYTTCLCAMNTIWTGTCAYGLQLTYIDNRNYPGGGPWAFLQIEFSTPSQLLSCASYIIGNIMADAILLWRCQVIWTGTLGRKVRIIMIFPGLIQLASIATGIVFAIDSASPAGYFSKTTASIALSYFTISLSLNIILTLMIAGRLTAYRRQGQEVLGQTYGKHYTSIATMFIESAALHSLCSFLLLITYALNHPINQIWLGLYPATQMISNYLIIYRVAQGRAWNTDTLGELSTVVFETRVRPGSLSSSGCSEDTQTTTTDGHPPHPFPEDAERGCNVA
ncbi:unnamed protein product [Somion occarium]|uniref:Uncharacterized protein n=1 Tax=Somion occarium TaxID=3059160 RepID=A0ABP1E4Y4_9APHY